MAQKKIQAPLPFRILHAVFPFLESWLPFLAKYIVVRLFFTPFRFKPRAGEEDLVSKANAFDLDVNGNKVHGRSWGENNAPLAVLVHGWSGRGMQMRHFIVPLANNGYRVVTFDAPGHGRSEGKDSSLLEFRDSLFQIEKRFGSIFLLIGHSLGAAACVFSIKEGLKAESLITISAPVIPDDIVNEFLKRINASEKVVSAIDEYVLQRTGEHFDYYSIQENVTHLADMHILAFHDADDKEMDLRHSLKMKEIHGNTELVITKGLGHNRILKDKDVIEQVEAYTQKALVL